MTEKAIREKLHELADKMNVCADNHGELNINACVILKEKGLTSINVNTVDGKRYAFTMKINLSGNHYNVILENFLTFSNTHDADGNKIPNKTRFSKMCSQVYAGHFDIINAIYNAI